MTTSPIITENLASQRLAVNGELPRFWRMNRLEAYYWGWQYEDLKYSWTDHYGLDANGLKVAVGMYQRKPKMLVSLPKAMVNAVVSFLFGRGRFPDVISEDEGAQEWIRYFMKKAKVAKVAKQVAALGNIVGTVFWTFQVINGKFSLKAYNGKVCYPTFASEDDDDPISVLIRFKFKDPSGVWRWFQKLYDQNRIVNYDQPLWITDDTPIFKELEVNEHGLGFVPGVWIRNMDAELPFHGGMFDGVGLYDDEGALRHFDAINYLASQFDRSLHYNLDPQLVLKKLTQADYDRCLAKSPIAPWVMGDGEAQLLEATGNTFDKAETRLKTMIATVCQMQSVILLDPTAVDIKADSSKALERLYAPMLTLIDSQRGNYGDEGIAALISKMLRAVDILKTRGFKILKEDDPGVAIKTDEVSLSWGDYFDRTPEDMKADIERVSMAVNSNLLSDESAVKYIASDFAIEDIAAEMERIEAQKAARISAFSSGPSSGADFSEDQ